jgi:hypothetical protein
VPPCPSAARSRPDVSHAQGPSKRAEDQGGESSRASSSWPNNHAGRRTAAHRERASAVALTPSAEERRRGKMPAQREHSEELSREDVEAVKEVTRADTPAAVGALRATGNRGPEQAVTHLLNTQVEKQDRETARNLQAAMDAENSSPSQSVQLKVRVAHDVHHGDQTSCETVAPRAAVNQANKHSSEEAAAVQSAPSATTGASSSKQPKNSGSAVPPRQAGRGRGGHNGAGDQRGRGRRGNG